MPTAEDVPIEAVRDLLWEVKDDPAIRDTTAYAVALDYCGEDFAREIAETLRQDEPLALALVRPPLFMVFLPRREKGAPWILVEAADEAEVRKLHPDATRVSRTFDRAHPRPASEAA